MMPAWSTIFVSVTAGGQPRPQRLLRCSQGLAELQPVPVILHHDVQHQSLGPGMPDKVGRWVLIPPLHCRDVRDLESPAARRDGDVANFLQVVQRAIQPHEDLRAARIDRTRGRHRILTLKCREHLLGADPEREQSGIGKIDEDLFRPFADNINLAHARHMQQALAHRFRLPDQQAFGQSMTVQRIDREIDIGIFVIDERSLHALRQKGHGVVQLLARLVELLGNGRRRGVVLERDHHQRQARPGQCFHPVVPLQFLHPLFQRIGHQILHFLRRGARPDSGRRQGFDGECGVLGTAETEERVGARQSQCHDQEQCDPALAHREGGQVESAHCIATFVEAIWTRSPTCNS